MDVQRQFRDDVRATQESDEDELAPSRLRAAADGAAAVVVSSALKHGSRPTRLRGMDLVVRWLATGSQKGARARLRKFLGLGGDNPLRKGVLEGLYELLDSISDDERVKAQACVARILRAVVRRSSRTASASGGCFRTSHLFRETRECDGYRVASAG